VILATAPDGKTMGTLIDRLGGKLVLVGASPEPFGVGPEVDRRLALWDIKGL
jgi:hypothetical protein